MPVHSLLIVGAAGNILFSRYFDVSILQTPGASGLFERMLFRHTEGYWERASINKETVTLKEVHVLFQKFGELLIYICGTDDIDEIICMYTHITSLNLELYPSVSHSNSSSS